MYTAIAYASQRHEGGVFRGGKKKETVRRAAGEMMRK